MVFYSSGLVYKTSERLNIFNITLSGCMDRLYRYKRENITDFCEEILEDAE